MARSTLRLALLVAALLSSGVQAAAQPAAQPDTGHLMQHYDRAQIEEGQTLNTAQAQRALADYANCLVDARRRMAESFLATFPFSAEANRNGQRLASSDCR